MAPPVIYTVGHSTRSFEELAGLLVEARVNEVVDVRHAPQSRIRPHLSEQQLCGALRRHGIAYSHSPVLGAVRASRGGTASPNRGWQQPALRGFADYMASATFAFVLDDLQRRARAHVVCMMCAEQHWRRCHRRLICDALVARGWRVMHLGIHAKPDYHELTPFAVIESDRAVTYPPLDARPTRPRLADRRLGSLTPVSAA